MPVAKELNAADFSSPQFSGQPKPPTIASAATIAPVTKMTFVTGTVQVATVTPPQDGYHEIVLVFTNAAPGLFLTSGNLITAYQPIQNRPIMLFFDPTTAKYWVNAVV